MDREELYYRLMYLMPNGGFIFWPYDESNPAEDKGCSSCLHYDGWVIGVYDSSIELPTIEQIQAVSFDDVEATKKIDRQMALEDLYGDNLAIRAAYNIEKLTYPELTFSEYIYNLAEQEL